MNQYGQKLNSHNNVQCRSLTLNLVEVGSQSIICHPISVTSSNIFCCNIERNSIKNFENKFKQSVTNQPIKDYNSQLKPSHPIINVVDICLKIVIRFLGCTFLQKIAVSSSSSTQFKLSVDGSRCFFYIEMEEKPISIRNTSFLVLSVEKGLNS